jgi:hypothetical protein
MISANCKTRLPEFKSQFVEGERLGTKIQIKTWEIVNAICAVRCIPRRVQFAVATALRAIVKTAAFKA